MELTLSFDLHYPTAHLEYIGYHGLDQGSRQKSVFVPENIKVILKNTILEHLTRVTNP